MKKLVSLLVFSLILFLALSINVSASSDLEETSDNDLLEGYVPDEEYEEAIPDEGFVEVEELVPNQEVGDKGLLVPTVPGNDYTTNTIARTMKWVSVSKTKKPDSYGAWKVCVDDISRTGSVSCSLTTGISNTYSGTIKAPIKSIEVTLGYSLTKSNSVMLRKSYDHTKGKRVKIIYRPVYTTYQVKQNRVVGSRVLETAYMTSRKYSHVQYDVIEY